MDFSWTAEQDRLYEQAREFAARRVKVTGTLDARTKTIAVESIAAAD